MKSKVIIILVVFVCVAILGVLNFADTTNTSGYGNIVRVAGIKVGDPESDGTVKVSITMKEPGTNVTKEKSRYVQIKGTDGPEEKAKKLAAAFEDIISKPPNEDASKDGFDAKGTSRSGSGGEVTTELPAKLKPKISIETEETGETDEAMNLNELNEFYSDTTATAPPDGSDSLLIGGKRLYTPSVIEDQTTTNNCINSIILKGNASGTWMGVAGAGVLNVSIAGNAYSTPTLGKPLDMLAIEIHDYYLSMGYPITMTGDPGMGFFISAGYFTAGVQAYDDTLVVGLELAIE